MIEETIQVTVTRATIATVDDVPDLLSWAQAQDGLYATVSARTDGEIYIEVGGVTVDSEQAELGDTITWDGQKFTVTKP